MSSAERIERMQGVKSGRRAGIGTVPNAWATLFIGVVVLTSGLLLCAVMITGYLGNRPVDLRAHTRALSDEIAPLLIRHRVDAAAILVGRADENRDADASWTHRRVVAALPSSVNPSELERALRDEFSRQQVTVVENDVDRPGEHSLRLRTGGREFAIVTLTGIAEPVDLTGLTWRIAEDIERSLKAFQPPLTSIERTASLLEEGPHAVWQFVRLRAVKTSATTLGAIHDHVARTLKVPGASIDQEPRVSEGNAVLTIRYREVPCAEIVVKEATASPDGLSPEALLPAMVLAFNGMDADELVRRMFPNAEDLPLDSSDLNGDAVMQARPRSNRPVFDNLRVAIIVDDGGYGGWVTEEILAMPNRLTLSILPHAPHSAETARRAAALGFEVMLHMPMENRSGVETYPGEITVTMDGPEMEVHTIRALQDVPGAVGINNHTGSKFTSHADAMRLFLEQIQDSGLFFIDSRTTRSTVAYDIAMEMRIPCAARDLFLDHESSPSYIRARFNQLIEIVKRQGSAIAICHFRPNTVPILKAYLPVFEKEGIEIVHASTMVR